MKLLRPLLVSLAVVFVLVAALVALAFAPPVQRWAVRRAVATQPDLKVEFARLAVGAGSAEMGDVTFEQRGLRVRATRVEAEYSLAAFIFQNRVSVSRVLVEGLEVDLMRLSEGEARGSAAGAPAAAPGAITQVRLPWELVVGDVRVAGRALLPGSPGKPAVPAEFELKGGGIAPGAEGRLAFRARVADASPGAAVTALVTNGEVRVRQTKQQTFDRAELTLTVDAEGPAPGGPRQLRLTAGLNTTAEGAAYALRVDTLQGSSPESLLAVEANAPLHEPLFSGRWTVGAQRAQLEPFFLGAALPEFALRGAGTFTVRTDNGAATVAGELRGQVSGLEVLDPAYRAFGTLKLETSFDAAAAQGVVRVNRLTGKLDNDRPVAAFEVKRAVAVNLHSKQLEIAPGDSEVGRLRLAGIPLAWVRPFVTAADVSGGVVSGEFVVNGDARALTVTPVQPLRVGALNVVQAGRLLVDRADFAVSPSVTVQPDRVAAVLREITLRTPAGDSVRGEMEIGLPLGKPPAFTIRARGEADLPRLLAPFAPIGHLRSRGQFDVTFAPARLDVRSYETELSTGAGKKVFSASASRAFAIDLRKLQVVAEGDAEVELGRIAFAQLALSDLPLMPSRLPASGQIEAGGFVAVAKSGRFLLRPTAPVRVSGLTVLLQGQRALETLAIQASPTIDFGGLADWKVTDGTTTVRDRSNALLVELTSEASASADGLRGALTFNADLAALGLQPVLDALRPLSAGRASGELRAAVDRGLVQVEGRSTLNGLVVREGNQPLPVANLSLRFTRGKDGRLALDLPLLLDRLGNRSDLRLAAEATPQPGNLQFTARLTSAQLELGDVLPLVALLQGPSAPARGAAPTNAATRANTPAAPAADVRPAWAGLQGEVAVELKHVSRGTTWSMKDFTATARVEPEAIRLTKVGGTFNEQGAITGQAQVLFRGGAQPYALDGDFSLSEFDVGALLKAFENEKSPTLEGVFSVKAKLVGSGATLDSTIERARGQFELQSRKGVFRGLRRTSDKVSVATKAVDAVAALGSLFGSDKVKGAAEKVAGQTYQVDQLAQALAELTFDQFVIRAERDERLNFRVDEISLVSPEVRLNARGSVSYVEGKRLLEQPLTLNYQLAARGKVEQMLGRLRALDGTKDELGYSKARNLGQITGTLARPVPNELFLRLAESKLGDFFN
jgi:hypothetical protein